MNFRPSTIKTKVDCSVSPCRLQPGLSAASSELSLGQGSERSDGGWTESEISSRANSMLTNSKGSHSSGRSRGRCAARRTSLSGVVPGLMKKLSNVFDSESSVDSHHGR